MPDGAGPCDKCGEPVSVTAAAGTPKMSGKKKANIKTRTAIIILVILVLLVIVAIKIPSFLFSTDRPKYNRCLQALANLKVAEEMYITDNKRYADMPDLEKLGMYMVPGCTNPNGCGNQLRERIDRNCKDFSIKTLNNGLDYEIKGTAADYSKCKICVTNRGYLPEKYSASGCAVFKCP